MVSIGYGSVLEPLPKLRLWISQYLSVQDLRAISALVFIKLQTSIGRDLRH